MRRELRGWKRMSSSTRGKTVEEGKVVAKEKTSGIKHIILVSPTLFERSGGGGGR